MKNPSNHSDVLSMQLQNYNILSYMGDLVNLTFFLWMFDSDQPFLHLCSIRAIISIRNNLTHEKYNSYMLAQYNIHEYMSIMIMLSN